MSNEIKFVTCNLCGGMVTLYPGINIYTCQSCNNTGMYSGEWK